MATRAKASSVVRKEKKVKETSPSTLRTPDAAAANLRRKTRPIAKQPSPIPPQSPLPNPLKPAVRSSRLDAPKPRKIPAAAAAVAAAAPRPYLHRRRSFDNKPNPNHNASRGGGARKALHKSMSISTSSGPPRASSKPVSRMPPPGRRLVARSAGPRTRKEEAADQPIAAARLTVETEAVQQAAAEISSCPDLDECMSNMESEHEEAEGLMGCAIDDELAEIESRGMSSPRGLIIPPSLSENSPPSMETDDFDEGGSNAKDGEGNEARAAPVGGAEEVKTSGQDDAIEAGDHGKGKEEKGGAEDGDGGGGEDSRAKLQSGGGGGKWKKAYNDVIEETKGKLMEERKNKVRALVGAFETVISLQEPPTHPES